MSGEDRSDRARSIGLFTASNLIVASMVGTGVFTTSGFLVADIRSKTAVLVAWIVGGVLALFGGLAYAELGAAFPGNGGEYQLLSRIYHPIVGFLAGWTSLVIGFSAPIAAYGIGFAKYLGQLLPGLPETPVAIALVVVMSAIHSLKVETSTKWQDALTYGKLALIVVFCAAGLLSAEHFIGEPMPVALGEATLSGPFATGLIWISFSYSGWNAASYIAGELKDPAKNLPRAVILGTLLVTVLYTWLNWVFLDAAPAAEIAGKVEVAHIAARHLFGDAASKMIAAVIALGLLSTTGAMIMTGPRVLEAMGTDYPRLGTFAERSGGRGPVKAIVVQGTLAVVFVVTASFDALVSAVGFVLSLWCLLTVLGVFVLRVREPTLARPYKTLGYPVTPVLFIALSVWMIGHQVLEKPVIAAYGAGAVATGLLLYGWAKQTAARSG